jgi:hypothetical protein
MRHEITFDKNEPFVTIRTLGELSAEGHLLFLKELITRPEWRAGMNALVDHRAASLAAITPYDLQLISRWVKQLKDILGAGGRCAIVLSDDAEFTKVAMWKVMTEPDVGFKIEFFDAVGDARKWLSADPRTAER